MPRLSIDVTPEEHQKLKAMAALQGRSIKDFVLERTIGDAPDIGGQDEGDAIRTLAAFLQDRIDRAEREGPSSRTVEEIRRAARAEAGL